jgi:hypothetical protein
MTVKGVLVPLVKAQTKAGTAILLMGQEVRIIRGQFMRIRDNEKKLGLVPTPEEISRGIVGVQMSGEDRLDCGAILIGDVHFLLVSIWRMWRLFERVRKDLPDEPELNEIVKKYRRFFEEIRRFRNRVEHIEGVVEQESLGLGDVRPSAFGFGGDSFDYGPEVESTITTFYREVKEAHLLIAKRRGLRPFERVGGQMRV